MFKLDNATDAGTDLFEKKEKEKRVHYPNFISKPSLLQEGAWGLQLRAHWETKNISEYL